MKSLPWKKIGLAGVVLVLIFYFITGKSNKSVAVVSNGQTREPVSVVLDLSQRKFQWMVNRQLDSLNAILDDRLKYIHSSGWIQTKEEVLADLRSGKLIYQKIEVKEMDARLYDSMAIVTGKGRFSGKGNGTPFERELLFTEVYVRKNNSWRLASRHASQIQ